ncbi:MAG: DMT family transporter [Deltaproteobacteria bacterium]|nr:DMT family transporter [Deltaproteobacteria bacterium]
MLVYLALTVAVLAVSTSAPLVHAASPAPAMTVAALRIAIAALLLSAIAGRRMAVVRRLSARETGMVVLAGALLACHFGVWISSLYLTSTAASVALVATQPMFAAVLARIFLRETLGGREVVGIGVAAAGCLLLAGGDLGRDGAIAGDLLAIAGAATAAAYLTVGRGLRASLPLSPYLAWVNLVAAVCLLTAALLMDAPLLGFESGVYLAILACAALPSLVGHTLLNWSVRRVAAHVVCLAILGEPIGASLIQWAAHGEVPPLSAVFGGAVILLGIAVGFARPSASATKLSGSE